MYLFTYLVNKYELAAWLEKLARHHELIIYSLLPLDLLKHILQNTYDVNRYISHLLSYDDVHFFDEYAFKDLSLLQEGRTVIPTGSESDSASINESNIILIQTMDDTIKVDPIFLQNCIQVQQYGITNE